MLERGGDAATVMRYRFGRFELDDDCRELRLGSREMLLQPRVFDLLLFLVRQRHRVVGKQEILDEVWPDVVVADGSVQRAVSLARSALAEGDAREMIRTHPRVGYRFVAEVEEVPGEPGERRAPGAELVRARSAYDHEDWQAGADLFRSADSAEGLDAADLERWAFAAQCAGRAAEAVPPLERAVAAHAAAGDRRGAARAAVLLAQLQLELRELPVARGWLRRAGRYLGEDQECREGALLAWTESRLALYEGRLEESACWGERVRALGERLDDQDLETLGLVYGGHARAAMGEVERGLARLDEAGAAVLAGEVSPWVGGVVYCGVIWMCSNLGDWHRASQWTEHFGRWCEASGVSGFPGLCRLHRAELLTIRGDLEKASGEVVEACTLLAAGAPWAEGDGHRILGDILLARDDLDGARAAYDRCRELGWDPQPGEARLEAARGRPDAAVRALERSLAGTGWAVRQRRALLLALQVRLAVRCADLEAARRAMAELEERKELWANPLHRAEVERARGELAVGEGRLDEAVVHLQASVRTWVRIGFDLGLATARLRLAELLAMDEDRSAAGRELELAADALRQLGATRLLRRCRQLAAELGVGAVDRAEG